MRVLRCDPGPPLDRLVECLWYLERHDSGHKRERALPTGTVDLIFNLSGGWSVIAGAHEQYFVIDTSQPRAVAGVHFRPGGAAAFLGAPAHELTGRHLPLEDVWGRGAVETVRERLLEAASPAAMFEVMKRALLDRLRRPLLPHPAVMYALRELTAAPAVARIETIRDESGYSARRLIELFRGSVGLTPKVYCRIRRFQAVIDRLAAGGRVEWCDVALDCGYYDQSHLAREFRAFSGLTPSEYRPVDPARPNHVALVE